MTKLRDKRLGVKDSIHCNQIVPHYGEMIVQHRPPQPNEDPLIVIVSAAMCVAKETQRASVRLEFNVILPDERRD